MKRILAMGTSLLALGIASSAQALPTWDYSETGSIVTFTAPAAGIYDITAIGGQGGGAFGPTGGYGADLSASFDLTAGEELSIAVGQQGQNGGWSGGGGGGTFVVGPNNSPLIIAGGGGGASSAQNGFNASLSTSANGGTSPGQGGYGPYLGGGGGGGFQSAGGQNGGGSWYSGLGGGGPRGQGGDYAFGGFGGGGGTQGGYNGGGGGGGGYSGGNGGIPPQINAWFYGRSYYSGGAGGGGSYVSASGALLSGGLNALGGDGSVYIQEVPEPASMGLLAAGIAGIGAIRRRRR